MQYNLVGPSKTLSAASIHSDYQVFILCNPSHRPLVSELCWFLQDCFQFFHHSSIHDYVTLVFRLARLHLHHPHHFHQNSILCVLLFSFAYFGQLQHFWGGGLPDWHQMIDPKPPGPSFGRLSCPSSLVLYLLMWSFTQSNSTIYYLTLSQIQWVILNFDFEEVHRHSCYQLPSLVWAIDHRLAADFNLTRWTS